MIYLIRGATLSRTPNVNLSTKGFLSVFINKKLFYLYLLDLCSFLT